MPSARLVGIGVFVFGGLILFAIALFMIGDRRSVFAQHVDVQAEFTAVAGLRTGAPVRVSGVDAGEVTDIVIPPSPASRFRVHMQVREEVRQLVRLDSIATIQTDGIVGNRFVQIAAGSVGSDIVPDGGFIAGREPFEFADLLARGGDTIDNVNATILQLQGHLVSVLATVGETTTQANQVIKTVSDDVEGMSRSGRRIAEDASRIVEGVRAGRGTVGKLINDDELYARAAGVAKQAEDTMRHAREAAERVNAAASRLQSGLSSEDGAFGPLVADLRQTVTSARDSMTNLAENTEALKRNFLFRGFFRERGFYDLDQMSAGEYRRGSLAGEHREPIRIWLRSEVLFASEAADAATGSSMVELLSPDGRARLDRGMAEVLRYPRTTPLIIEGYASGDTRDVRTVRAAERARQVREYVIEKYGLAPTLVGTQALGAEADGSPDGDHWDGIALAAWVDRRVLQPSEPN